MLIQGKCCRCWESSQCRSRCKMSDPIVASEHMAQCPGMVVGLTLQGRASLHGICVRLEHNSVELAITYTRFAVNPLDGKRLFKRAFPLCLAYAFCH